MSGYGKAFASMYTGSMVGSGAPVFAVWGYVIANKERSGEIDLHPVMVGAILGEPPSTIEAAIEKLCSPDPRSRNTAEDGRRLIQCGPGPYRYRVVSHEFYRELYCEEDRRDAKREWDREHRPSGWTRTKSDDSPSQPKPVRHQSDTSPTQSDTSPTQSDTSPTQSDSPSSPSPSPSPSPKEKEIPGHEFSLSPPLPDGTVPRPKRTRPADIETVWNRYLAGWKKHVANGHEPDLNDKRARAIAGRLKKFSVEELCKAIDAIWDSQWHCENGRTYPEIIFRSDEQVEKLLTQKSGSTGSRGAVPKQPSDGQTWKPAMVIK
jgi:hypothetical protein